MKRDIDQDLHAIKAEHADIHMRLLNWSVCQRSTGWGSSALPMFRWYRDGYHEVHAAREAPDTNDGVKVQKAFSQLPEKHRHAIGWAYVKPWIPLWVVCRGLALSRPNLCQLIHDARSILKNTTGHANADR